MRGRGLITPSYSIMKKDGSLTVCSVGLSVLTVLFLAMTREAYAIVVAFLLFVIKMALIWMSRA